MKNILTGTALCILSAATFSFAAGNNTGGAVQSKPFQVVNPVNAPASSKPFRIFFFYDPKVDSSKRMLEQVEKIRFNLKDYVDFIMLDVTSPENKKMGETYGLRTETVRIHRDEGDYEAVQEPYPALIAFGKSELFRQVGFMDESNLSPKLDAAGIRRPPVDPFLKIKLSAPPYVHGKGKILLFSLPPGVLDIRVYKDNKEVKKVPNTGLMPFWDIKDSNGEAVEPGKYTITIKDLNGHQRNFEIQVE